MTDPAIVVMGVSGCGKTTVGRSLARVRGAEFIEADDLHPPENVARMSSGVSLDDEARAPWLDILAVEIERELASDRQLVVACSALKRAYRDRLRQAGPVLFVLLDAPEDIVRQRLDARTDHFMPASLLADQLATLERPGPDEPDAVIVDASAPLDALVPRIDNALAVL